MSFEEVKEAVQTQNALEQIPIYAEVSTTSPYLTTHTHWTHPTSPSHIELHICNLKRPSKSRIKEEAIGRAFIGFSDHVIQDRLEGRSNICLVRGQRRHNINRDVFVEGFWRRAVCC